jgi:hypothetical protein
MATPTVYAAKAQGDYPAERKTFLAGYIFGAPVKDMGWFASLLMALATGMMAFFLATFLGIVALLFWHSTGHQPDFAISYRLIGLPVGATVMVLALAYMGMLWVRRISRKS